LKQVLSLKYILTRIKVLQATQSHESLGIQLADLLMGASLAKFNGRLASAAKRALVERIEHHIRRPIAHTMAGEKKFNVFQIKLDWGFNVQI
jgi:hypothetical protein